MAAMALPVLSYIPELAFTVVTAIELTTEGPMLNIVQFEQNGRVVHFHALLKQSREITPARDEPTVPDARLIAASDLAAAATTVPLAAPAATGILASAPLVTVDALAAGVSSAVAAWTLETTRPPVTANAAVPMVVMKEEVAVAEQTAEKIMPDGISPAAVPMVVKKEEKAGRAAPAAPLSMMWLMPEIVPAAGPMLMKEVASPTVMPTVLLAPEAAPAAEPMMMKEVPGGPTVMPTVLLTPEVAPEAVPMMMKAEDTGPNMMKLKEVAVFSSSPTSATPTVAPPADKPTVVPCTIVPTVLNMTAASSSSTPSATPTVNPSAAIPKIGTQFPEAGSSPWTTKPHVVAQWKPHTDIRLQMKE